MVTATNPKVVLLWASLSKFVGPAIESWPVLLLFTLGAAVIIFLIYGTYGLLFSMGACAGSTTSFSAFPRLSLARCSQYWDRS